MPLITIDPEDARDHDDAVWAEADRDCANPGGWRVVVAIADVAQAVRPGGALDREARERGNSAYFPDRVVPMLPEPLSAGACSLKPGVDRACLALDMRLDAQGRTVAHRFVRGLMRSAARLDYAQVQRAREGDCDTATGALMEGVIAPLYGAYGALRRARQRREPLDIEVPEREVRLDADGRPKAIVTRPRLDSHRLIEELMIAANVCAARTLGEAGVACMYRIHDRPPPDKLEAVRDVLGAMGYRLAKGQVLRPALFKPHPRRRRLDARGRGRQSSGPARPGAGTVQPRKHRPLRPRARRLRALHFTDSPLRRFVGSPRPDRGVRAGRGRAGGGRRR